MENESVVILGAMHWNKKNFNSYSVCLNGNIETAIMKKVILFLFCLQLMQFDNALYAQMVSKSYTSSVMKAFIDGQTYAVLTDDEAFNLWLQSTLKKLWGVNAMQFIRESDLDSAVSGINNFFLYPFTKDSKTGAGRLLNSEDLANKREFYFVLSQGGYKQAKLLYASGTGGSKILGSFRYGPDRAEMTAGMLECEIMLALLNQSLQAVIDFKIRSTVKDSVKWTISDANDKLIADQTLLINRTYYDGTLSVEEKPLVSEKVLEGYLYEYLVIGKDSVQEFFDTSTGEYCYLFFYFPTARIKTTEDSGDIIIYDPYRKRVLYYEDNVNGPWFEKWKMKLLLAAIKSK